MKLLSLLCHAFIPSCDDPTTVLKPGEHVYLVVDSTHFTDPNFNPLVPALTTAVTPNGENFDYQFEFDEASLPHGVTEFCAQNIKAVICKACCDTPALFVAAGEDCNNVGPATALNYGGLLKVVSESLEVTLEGNCLRIEAPESPYSPYAPYFSPANT